MKRILWIVSLVFFCVLIWRVWPTTEKTFSLSVNGVQESSISVPARPEFDLLPSDGTLVPWFFFGTVFMTILFAIDAKYIGIVGILNDKRTATSGIEFNFRRMVGSYLTIAALGICWLILTNAFIKPTEKLPKKGFIRFTYMSGSFELASPALIEGEADGEMTLTNELGVVVLKTTKQEESRIGWSQDSDYWYVPKTLVPAGTYTLNGGEYEGQMSGHIRIFTDSSIVYTYPLYQQVLISLLFGLFWGAFSFMSGYFVYIKE